MNKKQIDYYGDSDNYIHLKFGDARKMYCFTEELKKFYPNFCEEYKKYWDGDMQSRFHNAFQVVAYVYDLKLPIHFYYNFTDTPVKNKKEVIDYLLRENLSVYNLDN